MTKEELIKWLKKENYAYSYKAVLDDDVEYLVDCLVIEPCKEYRTNIINYLRLRKLSLIEKAG